MPVNKRRKKKQRKQQPQSLGGLTFFKHPFSTVPHETLKMGLADAGRRHGEQFPSLLEKTQETINSVDALQAISTLSMYGLMGSITEGGKRKPFADEDRFNQSHVELVQALALRTPEDQRSRHPSLPDVIQNLFDELPELADAFHYRRLIWKPAVRLKKRQS